MALARPSSRGPCEEEDHASMRGERGGDCVSPRAGGGRDSHDRISEHGTTIVSDHGAAESPSNGREWEKGYSQSLPQFRPPPHPNPVSFVTRFLTASCW
uniref:Uncharacterized protein n=1 Tax=Physcomitrium patens TaxID=3218 RepID=A0A2K1K9R0_PHYPA|nr:hypothetical protein PHYPA_009697 [Physcomitrium patens]